MALRVGTDPSVWSVQVINPDSSASKELPFRVVAPKPEIPWLVQQSAPSGTDGFTLTVTGMTFTTSSVVRWNGKDLPTTPIENRSHFVVGLNATVSTTDLIQPRDVNITIFSLGPGGGASAPAIFRILPRQSSLLLKARYPAKRRAKKTFAVTI